MDKAKIFEVSEMIPEETVIPRKYQPATDETLLNVHRNNGDGSGSHLGNMDDVDRGAWPDAAQLESKIMGNQDIPTSVNAGVRPELSAAAGEAPNATRGSRRTGLNTDKSRPVRVPKDGGA